MDSLRGSRLRPVQPSRDDDLQALAEEVRLRYQTLGALYLREAGRLSKALRRPGSASRLALEVQRAMIVLEPWNPPGTPGKPNPVTSS